MPSHLHRVACAAMLLLVARMLAAQQSSLKFDRMASEQGISDNYISCMVQGRRGLIWFGTRDGLNRYDGYTVTVYRADAASPGSLSDGGIECLMEDDEEILWMGTLGGGLNRFDRLTGRFTHFLHDPADPRSITAGAVIAICSQGRYVWIVTNGTGERLCRLDKRSGEIRRFRHSPADRASLSSDKVTSVACDSSGGIWVGTLDGGLNRFDPATGGFINGRNDGRYSARRTGEINRLTVDREGTLWFWSNTALRWLHPGAWESASGRIDSLTGTGIPKIYALHRDRSGTLWIGGSDGGARVMRGDRGVPISVAHNGYDPHTLASDRIYCIMEDRSGNIWLGTDNGISRFNRRNWQLRYYQHDPFDSTSISNGAVRHITKDREGNLWIAMESGGVNRLAASTGAITRYNYDLRDRSSLNDNTANVIYSDRNGDIWIGTNTGLARFDRKRRKFHRYLYGPPDGFHLPHHGVWSILEDRKGDIWIGTFGGLCSLDRKSGRIFHHRPAAGGPRGPISDLILSLHEDRDGNLWAGTQHGLSRLDRSTGSWRHYLTSTSFPSGLHNRIWYIHEDRHGILWLATSGTGLRRLDPRTGEVACYSERDGLAGNIACAILEDRRGRLWISTTRGLSVFDQRTGRFRTYALKDGFYVHAFHFKSCFEDERGWFYFGGSNGIITFHPDSILDNDHRPDIMVTSFRIFNNETVLDISGSRRHELRLKPGQTFFSFGFAALDFTNSLRNRYRYRLEGFDEEWRETDGRHPRASYTNVPPGNYLFHVRGANSDGVWNDTGLAVDVVVEPAYWETWWFQGAFLLMGVAAAGAAIMGRIRTIRRQGRLERKVVEYQLKALRAQMNPHFLFNSLNSILLFMLDHDIDSVHRYLTKFARLMRSTLELSKSEMVPLGEELEALRCYMEMEALRLDDAFAYAITVAPEIDIEAVMIPPMLIQPHVENAIKHGLKPLGSGGELSIDIRLDGEAIVYSVADNGIGRDRAAAARNGTHRSYGLDITRERLDVFSRLSRQCYKLEIIDLTGEEGSPLGTRVEVRIPIALHLHQSEPERIAP